MCILSFIPRDVEITSDVEIDLFNGGISNPDGYGWAIASDNGVMLVGKSLNLDEAVEGLSKARASHDGPALFHSRWATHGSIKQDNCHPFYVGTGNQTVLGHNGILPQRAMPAAGDDRSDTAVMAEDLMPVQWKRLDRPGVQKSLAEFCGSNKLVILTVNPRYRRNAYIVNEDLGVWDGPTGVWHSNTDYRYSWTPRHTLGTSYVSSRAAVLDAETGIDPTSCIYCAQRVNAAGVCSVCGTCQDCLEESFHCQCWSGSATLRDLEGSIDPDMPIPFSITDIFGQE